MNQRALIRMTPEEVRSFLDEPNTMAMCSMRPDGTIHAVAMYFGYLEDSVAVHTKAKSQKVRNLERDPRLTVLVESGSTYDELRGVELVGQAEIVRQPERVLALAIDMHERYHGPYTDDLRAEIEDRVRGRVAIRLVVDRVVSWDHRKLAGLERAVVVR
jgi:PPOX class probable F420-dependent enzyme